MTKFRKIPVTIEAAHFLGLSEHDKRPIFDVYPDWLETALEDSTLFLGDMDEFMVITLEGSLKISVGDWVLRGISGELYPCKPDIFAKTYECVEDITTINTDYIVDGRDIRFRD